MEKTNIKNLKLKLIQLFFLLILLSIGLCFWCGTLSASSLKGLNKDQTFKIKEKNNFILAKQERKSSSFRDLSDLNSDEIFKEVFKIKEKNSFILAKSKNKSKKRRRFSKRSRKSRSSYGNKRTRRLKQTSKRRRMKKKKLAAIYYLKRLRVLYKEKKYSEASKRAFRMMMSPKFKKYKPMIRYILGLTLYRMNLNQAAAFQFINIIKRSGRSGGESKDLIKKSLKQLYLAANQLEDDTLLNYALSKIVIKDFPEKHRDMLYFRIGEIYLDKKRYEDGIKMFNIIQQKSPFFYKARYLKALGYSYLKMNKSALKVFEDLVSLRYLFPENDPIKASAIIGKARVLYQDGKWDEAIRHYRDVPKDTQVWHESLLEMSWALLRTSKFRSALGLLHSLHSSFYENFYAPEALLLRAIVYLYICKYEELEKTLNLHHRIYSSLQKDIDLYLRDKTDPLIYFSDAFKTITDVKKGTLQSVKYSISPLLALKIYRSGRFYRIYKYIKNLIDEKKNIESMPSHWREASIGRYVEKVLMRRIAKARKNAGREVKTIMKQVNLEVLDYLEQERLIYYEMTNSQVRLVKEKIKKKLKSKSRRIDFKSRRSFYVQNGYEYWPFQGEYWLDELGNYYYLGTSSCGMKGSM